MVRRDDHGAWDDDPIVQALRAPGSPEELAGEEQMRAAFRAAAPSRSRRRYAGRVGAGGSALVAALALSGGVAAAYTQSLPDSIQRVAHDVLSPFGVPPAPPRHHATAGGSGARGGGALGGRPTTSPTPAPHATSSGSVPGRSGGTPPASPRSDSSLPAGVAPTVTATSSPTAVPTPSPTPTSTPTGPGRRIGRLRPKSVSITVSVARVPVGQPVTVTGQVLSRLGRPVVGRAVGLVEWTPGAPGHTRLPAGRTDADGDVSVSTPALSRTVRLRLRTGHGVHSAPARVVVVPSVSATPSPQGSTYKVTVTTVGGQPGDTVVLRRYRHAAKQVVDSAVLTANGTAQFTVPEPRKRSVRYVVAVPATQAHGWATTHFIASPITGG